MTGESRSRNPYPGPRPFEIAERDIFFGRDREVKDLLSLIIAHRVVLLYAQSGAGKTSLLNAGLIPLLKDEGFEVLPVARVRGFESVEHDRAEIPNIYVFNTLIGWAYDRTDSESLASASISDFLGGLPRGTDEQDLPSPRIAIFDQFEEIFTFYPERWQERELFFRQIADALEADPLLRVLFVMREDYLANMDPYAKLLPEQLRTRYRLERLRKEAACSAVEGPLKNTDISFGDGVAQKLVDQLLNIRYQDISGKIAEAKGEYVEPVQLQVVCQNLWQNLPSDVKVITEDHLQQFGDVEEALTGLYEKAVEAVQKEAGVSEKEIRNWFNNELITPAGTRGTIFRDKEKTGRIPNLAVDILENKHIIRAEIRSGARWYELTHDRMIEPIRKSNAAQRANKQERNNLLLRLLVIALTIGLILLVVAFFLYRNIGKNPVYSVAFSPDGTRIVTGGLDRTAKVWDASTGKKLLNLTEVNSIVFSPDGTRIVTMDVDGTAKLLDAFTGEELFNLPEVNSIAFSTDGTRIVTMDMDGTERLLDAFTGKELLNLTEVRSVVFSMDETRIITMDLDRTAKLLDTFTGKKLLNLPGVNSIVFSPDGTRIATGSYDGTAKVWDASTGEVLLNLTEHEGEVYSVAFSPDGTRIATGSYGPVKVWDASSGKKLLNLTGYKDWVNSIAFSPDGSRIATGSDDGTVEVWDISTGRELHIFKYRGYSGEVNSVAFSPDGTRIVTGSNDGTVAVLDASTGKELLNTKARSVVFSPDGTRIVTDSWRIWDASTGKELLNPTMHIFGDRGRVNSVVRPDGSRIVIGSDDGTVEDASTGKELFTLTGHKGGINSVSFNSDGTRIATGSDDRTAKVWDASSGAELLNLAGHKDSVRSVSFSPDGTRLVTGSWDGTAKVWDASTGKRLLTIRP